MLARTVRKGTGARTNWTRMPCSPSCLRSSRRRRTKTKNKQPDNRRDRSPARAGLKACREKRYTCAASIRIEHLSDVILGLVPRIYCSDRLADPRDKPEDDVVDMNSPTRNTL